MITRLDLQDYGKFRKASLEFGPFTVVTGPNEAGKTTVFDALFDAVCAPSRHEGRPAWKNLAERYGALRRAVPTWEGEPFSLDFAEYLDVFAIRAGDTGVNASNAGAWEALAEAKLLNSGLNPGAIAEALLRRATGKGKGGFAARIAELQRSAAALQPELEGLKARRDAIFAGESETVEREAELKGKGAELEQRQAELKALTAKMDELGDACRLRSAQEGLQALRDVKEAGEAAAALAAYSKNEMPEFRALSSELAERERAVASAESALKERRAAADAVRAAAEQLAAREPELRRVSEGAAALAGKLSSFFSAPPKAVSFVDKKLRFGIWGGALLLAALVAFTAGGAAAYAAALALLAAGGWAGWKFSVRERLEGRPEAEAKAFMDSLAAEWALLSPEPLPADKDGAAAAFARPPADHAALLENYNSRAAELGEHEAALGALEESLAEYRKASAGAADAVKRWLELRACVSEDEYQQRAAEYKAQSAREADLREKLKVYLRRFGCADAEALRNKLHDDREAMERKGVDPAKADEQELERLKQKAAAAARAVRDAEAAAASVRSALEKARAVAGARLEGLPERINAAETGIAAAREEIAGLELQAQACQLAAEVFNRLAERSTVAFAELAKEVSSTLAFALPGAAAEFRSFDAAEAAVRDAGGSLRRVGALSSGMRDLFMLAARLALAKKARLTPDGALQPGLIVLDDPLYTLDPDRERAALRLLVAFHRETNWQVVVFTKDVNFAKAALGAGISVKITELK